MRANRKRERARTDPPSRVVDATAGPPREPDHDPAADRLLAEQAGAHEVVVRDAFSFIDGVSPLYVRIILGRQRVRLARSRIENRDEEEIAADNVRAAEQELTRRLWHETQLLHEDGAHDKIEEEAIADLRATGQGHRVNEPRWVTLAWLICVPLVAALVEIPWSYFALEILGEGNTATVAMAVVYGAVGVVLAEIIGVVTRRTRDAEAGTKAMGMGVVAGAVLVLAVIGYFLADVRTAYLATPIVGPGGANLPSALSTFHLARTAVLSGWLFVSLGLWLAVAVSSHLHSSRILHTLQRAKAVRMALCPLVVEAKAGVIDAKAALVCAQARKANVKDKWAIYRHQLVSEARALVAIWQLGLVLQAKDPEMTTAVESHDFDIEGALASLETDMEDTTDTSEEVA